MFGAGKGGLINPPDPEREFPLLLAELAVMEQDVYDLIMDMTILYDMSKVCNYIGLVKVYYSCYMKTLKT